MNHGPDLTGMVITLFGDRAPLDDALSLELGRRGGRTHTVTARTGWLASAAHVILRLDTESGAEALVQLANADHPRSHVVAVCAEKPDPQDTQQIDDLCRSCGEQHDFSLIWHPEPTVDEALTTLGDGAIAPTEALAAAIVEEVRIHATPGRTASYEARTFDPTRWSR